MSHRFKQDGCQNCSFNKICQQGTHLPTDLIELIEISKWCNGQLSLVCEKYECRCVLGHFDVEHIFGLSIPLSCVIEACVCMT